MKLVFVLPVLSGAIFLSGCGEHKTEGTHAAAPPEAAVKPGQISIPADSPKLKQIRVETVESADVPEDEVIAPGKVEMNPDRISRVTLPLAGRISGLTAHIGDNIQQGQILFSVESPDADTALAAQLQVEAAISINKVNITKAQTDYDRVKDLFEHNAVARKDVLNAENSLAQAKSALEQNEVLNRQALRRLELLGLKPKEFGQKVAVRAPISGKVMEVNAVQGEFRNDTNLAILTIADLSTVWMSADVPESAIRLIQVNEHLEIEMTAYPGEVFRARVTRIADGVDPQTRTIKVRAVLDNPKGRFRPEMFGKIRHVDRTRKAPVVAPGAVIQGDGQNIVIREISAGLFEQVRVETGNRVKDRIPILSGLKAGDRDVVDGARLLRN